MHGWLWDLRYPAPRATRSEYPISAVPGDTPRAPGGPMAVPGEYTLRLTANEHTSSEPLDVKMDPRVKGSERDLAEELEKQQLLAGMMTQTTQAGSAGPALPRQGPKLTGKTPPLATPGGPPRSPGRKNSRAPFPTGSPFL